MLKGSGHGAIAEKWADSAGFCWIPGPLRLWGCGAGFRLCKPIKMKKFVKK